MRSLAKGPWFTFTAQKLAQLPCASTCLTHFINSLSLSQYQQSQCRFSTNISGGPSSKALKIKELMQKSGSPLGKCRKALEKANEDVEAALHLLLSPEVNLSDVAEKAREGAVWYTVSKDKHKGLLLEMNCQTDFLSGTDAFFDLRLLISKYAVQLSPELKDQLLVEAILALSVEEEGMKQTLKQKINQLIANTGEAIELRRARWVTTENGVIGAYSNGSRCAALVALEVHGAPPEEFVDFANELAGHIAAFKPKFLTPEESDDKSDEYIRENVLLAQSFDAYGTDSVRLALEEEAEEHSGCTLSIKEFVRFELEIPEPEDFRSEVERLTRKT